MFPRTQDCLCRQLQPKATHLKERAPSVRERNQPDPAKRKTAKPLGLKPACDHERKVTVDININDAVAKLTPPVVLVRIPDPPFETKLLKAGKEKLLRDNGVLPDIDPFAMEARAGSLGPSNAECHIPREFEQLVLLRGRRLGVYWWEDALYDRVVRRVRVRHVPRAFGGIIRAGPEPHDPPDSVAAMRNAGRLAPKLDVDDASAGKNSFAWRPNLGVAEPLIHPDTIGIAALPDLFPVPISHSRGLRGRDVDVPFMNRNKLVSRDDGRLSAAGELSEACRATVFRVSPLGVVEICLCEAAELLDLVPFVKTDLV